VELAFDGEWFIAVSFCIEIYASGVVFGYSFNPLGPCSWSFEFILFDLQQFSSARSMLDYPLQSSCCGANYLSLIEVWDSPAVTVGSGWSLCTVGGRPPSTCRVANCHSVEELEFQLLDKKEGALLQGGTV
jgi:hypothetical protein